MKKISAIIMLAALLAVGLASMVSAQTWTGTLWLDGEAGSSDYESLTITRTAGTQAGSYLWEYTVANANPIFNFALYLDGPVATGDFQFIEKADWNTSFGSSGKSLNWVYSKQGAVNGPVTFSFETAWDYVTPSTSSTAGASTMNYVSANNEVLYMGSVVAPTAVPEPTYALFAFTGLSSILGFRKMRKKS